MIGIDFPLKPQWIHDVHQLWQPNELISDLVAHALASTMQELGGEKTRRNTLSIILRNFVSSEGGGTSRRTVSQDIWVAFSKKYSVSTLAPAYLIQIISHNELAGDAVHFINRYYPSGAVIKSEELKRTIIGKYGERKVVTNAVSAFLRTLQHFSVLEPVKSMGEYRVRERLALDTEIFPIAFWSFWSLNPVPQFDLDTFNQSFQDAFIADGNLESDWKGYQSSLWGISDRLGTRTGIANFPDPAEMGKVILGLVD